MEPSSEAPEAAEHAHERVEGGPASVRSLRCMLDSAWRGLAPRVPLEAWGVKVADAAGFVFEPPFRLSLRRVERWMPP